MFKQVLFICFSLSIGQSFKLVGETGQCYKNDENINACLLQAFNNLKSQIRYGDVRFGIPSLDPLFVVKNINLTHSSNEGYFHCEIHNIVIEELYNYEVIKVDFTKDKLMIDVKFDKLNLSSEFSADGVFMDVPIDGKAKGDELYSPVLMSVVVMKDTTKKGNVEHCNILSVKFNFDVIFADAHVDGLKISGTNRSAYDYALEHKKKMSNFASRVFETLFETLWTEYLKNMCDHVPYSDLLPDRP